MGIRVHKFMGYGLDDIEAEQYTITDPRINTESPIFSDYDDLKVEDYITWLEERYSEDSVLNGKWNLDCWVLRDHGEKSKNIRFSDAWAWSPEYGMSSVFVLKPLTMTDWSRFDDGIDYAVETHLTDHSQTTRVDRLKFGQYPWNGIYMDARTGERVKDGVRWTQLHWTPPPEDLRRAMAKSLGFDTPEEADKYLVPLVPEEIIDIAEYTNLFTEGSVWMQLRPMLYTYWA